MRNYLLEKMIVELESDLDYMDSLGPECKEKTNAVLRLEESLMWLQRWNRRLRDSDDEDDV